MRNNQNESLIYGIVQAQVPTYPISNPTNSISPLTLDNQSRLRVTNCPTARFTTASAIGGFNADVEAVTADIPAQVYSFIVILSANAAGGSVNPVRVILYLSPITGNYTNTYFETYLSVAAGNSTIYTQNVEFNEFSADNFNWRLKVFAGGANVRSTAIMYYYGKNQNS